MLDLATKSPLALATGLKYCLGTDVFDDLMDLAEDFVGIQGIGMAPVIGERRDESELLYRRDVVGFFSNVGWVIAFVCVSGLTISAVLMIVKRCKNPEEYAKKNEINWEELEVATPQGHVSRDSANISGSALATPSRRGIDNDSQIDHTDIAEISLRMDLKHASGSQTKATRTPATDDFSMVEEKPNGPKLIGGESDDMLGLASKANMRYSVEDGISMRASVNLHSSVEGTNLANLAANIAAANQDQTTQNQNPAPGTQLGSGHI